VAFEPAQATPSSALSERTPHNGDRHKTAPSDASIWIRCCFGRQQTSKRNCSISGPTLTTIARIPRWKGEHQMRPRHDQSSISARLDGNLTVGTYIRRQWLRDFQKTLDRCDIRSNSARLPRNHSVFLRRAFRGSDQFTVHCHLVRSGSETQLTFAARLTATSTRITIRGYCLNRRPQ